MLILFLEVLHDYIVKNNITSFVPFYHIFKSINTNIRLIQQEANTLDKPEEQEDIQQVRTNFDSYLTKIQMSLSDDSDQSNDDGNQGNDDGDRGNDDGDLS
ncbi:unnamed protein product [Rotaria sp. Silwood2]|nr:unnamed protein product [Rotaria sp. Silwood2]CAF3079222.1 unnamed protein product [Rotaria sp. Silwood2]CAF3169002.1 unnamed protein product [Rotaria sp. Silwood2]CAF3483679.1 unnamed protein product [Rotaria sp. Silwood2]CAF4203727.1 unnamed protein product [Rotaria sp. Silwood2]